jgi:hypothetical protein
MDKCIAKDFEYALIHLCDSFQHSFIFLDSGYYPADILLTSFHSTLPKRTERRSKDTVTQCRIYDLS